MSKTFRVELLGRLRVVQGEKLTTHFETRKTAALLGILALSMPQGCSRETLLEHLWPNEDPEATRMRLRQALSALRRVLDLPDALLADRLLVRLNPACVITDLAEFEAALAAAARSASAPDRQANLEAALSLAQGELLPGFSEDVILAARDRHAEAHRGALIALAGRLSETGAHALAIDTARQAVQADPCDESAQFALIQAYSAAGRPSEALRQAREMERVLREELDSSPSQATRAFLRSLRAEPMSEKGPSVECIKDRPQSPEISLPRRLRPKPWAMMLGLGVVLVPLAFALRHRADQAGAPVGDAQTVAVLPFDMIGPGGSRDAYFADGLTEELTNALGQIKALTVVGPISAAGIKSSLTTDGSPVARQLDVGTLIQGNVSREPAKLRVRVRALDARTQRTLWSAEYDKPYRVDDVLEIEGDVSQRVAEALRVRLTVGEQGQIAHKFTDNVAAYDDYLQGRYLWNQRTEASLKQAIVFYDAALALDPHYAPANVGKANAYAVLGYYGYVPSRVAVQNADAAANQAVAAASGDGDTLAGAYSCLGWVAMVYRRDWAAAQADFATAKQSSPDYATAYQWDSLWLMLRGRQRESVNEILVALRADPLSFIIGTSVGGRYYYGRQYAQAIQQYDRVLALNPDYTVAYFWRGLAWAKLGRQQEAQADLRTAVARSGGASLFLAFLGQDYALAGQRAKAAAVQAILRQRSRTEYVDPFCLAVLDSGLGERDTAFSLFDQALRQGDGALTFLEEAAPAFDFLGSDARYTALRARMGLPKPDTAP